jgi:tetratricopeptide (TPR) repeat protein
MKPATLALLTLLLFALGGCTIFAPKPDPVSASEHQTRAERLIINKQYQQAAVELDLALRKNPERADLYLRYGDLLESLSELAGARSCYETALKKTPPTDPARIDLTYQLGLLYATKLESEEQARIILKKLPHNSLPRKNLEAALTLQDGDGRKTLILLNEMLQTSLPRDMAARVMYQAALAYHLIGDAKNATGSLLKAISYAENLALTRDIEIFWNKLNDEPDSLP